MKQVFNLLFFLHFCPVLGQDECPKDCVRPELGKPSIVVRRTAHGARLGNKMVMYASLLSLKVHYNLQVFVMKSELQTLQIYFENLEIEAADDQICNFEEDYGNYAKLVWQEREKLILKLMRNLTNDEDFDFVTQNGTRSLSIPEEHQKAYFKLVNSPEYFNLDIDMPDPWVMFTSYDMDRLYSDYPKGHAIFIQQTMLDYTFLQNSEVKQRILENFRLKEKYLQLAKQTIKKLNISKKICVGMHVRKTDYEDYERSRNLPVTQASFYINAMKSFKKNLGSRVVFLLITDDIRWCKNNLPDRKDLLLVSNPKLSTTDSVGHDMAIMSLCQHSIVSRGTFSRWAKFLAQGKSISPHCIE